ncbi:hypothetical protein CISG_07847 [Coccidioides immitis RMSCC 3703]|uniref:Uncharacterized protein n=1 Tax=Coccidioides immitis RMSCC 3703 TaxID=454286 RepID=A0A0J8R3W0_COCIT|nr:hypothetical protein CISG_07847 [Coccidioides immitis RMSCC 3703]
MYPTRMDILEPYQAPNRINVFFLIGGQSFVWLFFFGSTIDFVSSLSDLAIQLAVISLQRSCTSSASLSASAAFSFLKSNPRDKPGATSNSPPSTPNLIIRSSEDFPAAALARSSSACASDSRTEIASTASKPPGSNG